MCGQQEPATPSPTPMQINQLFVYQCITNSTNTITYTGDACHIFIDIQTFLQRSTRLYTPVQQQQQNKQINHTQRDARLHKQFRIHVRRTFRTNLLRFRFRFCCIPPKYIYTKTNLNVNPTTPSVLRSPTKLPIGISTRVVN